MAELVQRLAREVSSVCAARLLGVDGVETKLLDLVARARLAWPDIDIQPIDFLRYFAERIPVDGNLEQALSTLHAADLYVACGCVKGDARALAAFEHHFLADVATYLARNDALSDFSDEVKQVLRHRLFVGSEGMLPRIASYTGRGPLKAWLRIAMTRAAIDLRRRAAPTVPADDTLPEPRASTSDPELAYLKAHYQRELAHAMRATLASLSDRESNVLWLRYYQGMSADAIGATYRVSARTVQRWLDLARERVLLETQKVLAERLKVEPSEVRQMVRMAHSQLEVSFSRLLRRLA